VPVERLIPSQDNQTKELHHKVLSFWYNNSMNVLFICNGNVARSQEAELFFNTLSKKNHAQSAGINVEVGKPIDPLVTEVMDELGYSMEHAERKFADEALVDVADLIVSFKPFDELPDSIRQRENIRYWNVPDPQHQPTEFHRKVRDTIKRNVEELVKENE